MIRAMRTLATLSIIAMLACTTAAAASDDFSGLLESGYAYDEANSKIGKHADQYDARGAVLFTLDNPGFAIQLDAATSGIAHAGTSSRLWSAGGDLFWRDDKGTFGISGSYSTLSDPAFPVFSVHKDVENYGLFGEYYVTDNLTLQIRGGGIAGNHDETAYTGGGGLTFYDSPDLAFHSEINFTAFKAGSDWTDIDTSLEYLPFRSFPLGFYAGYDWSNVTHEGYVSTIFAGLRLHLAPGGSLADFQRTGPIDWTGAATDGAKLKF
jgi:hypothetical protein